MKPVITKAVLNETNDLVQRLRIGWCGQLPHNEALGLTVQADTDRTLYPNGGK
jgi:hypothetical protein